MPGEPCDDGEFLFVVQLAVDLPPLGLVLTRGVPVDDPRIGKGDPIELRRPDGSCLRTEVASFMWPEHGPHFEGLKCKPIVLPPPLSSSDVPVGTKVWFLGEPRPALRKEERIAWAEEQEVRYRQQLVEKAKTPWGDTLCDGCGGRKSTWGDSTRGVCARCGRAL